MKFNSKKIEDLQFNPFTKFSKQWALLTAEKDGKVNTMTVSWGGIGVLWNKNVATVYVRPQRYTREFIDGSTNFSLSFLPESFRQQLTYLGKASGRDEDKIAKAGLTVQHKDGVPFFEEAEQVYVVKKLFVSKMTPENFLDKSLIEKNYSSKDYHFVYIGEITDVLEK